MKRVIFILLVTLVGIIASFYDAYFGLLLYSWFSFASPLQLTFGELDGWRLSLLVGIVVIVTTLHQRRQLFVSSPLSYLSIAFLGACILSLAAPMHFSLSYVVGEIELIAKLIIMTLITPVLVVTLPRLRSLILVIAVSTGLLGFYYGVFGLLAGSISITGAGRIGDNNGYAVWLTGTLPILYFAGSQLKQPLQKLGARAVLFGNILAVLLTFSRAGLLSTGLCLSFLVFQMKNRLQVIFLLTVMLAIVGPATYFNVTESSTYQNAIAFEARDEEKNPIEKTIEKYGRRVNTLLNGRTELESAKSRIHFWNIALEMTRQNPLFGVGFSQYRNVFDDYDTADGRFGRARSVHSTPLLILSETGSLGFLLFSLLFLGCITTQSKVKRRAANLSDADSAKELFEYVAMLRISMIGFFFGSLFVVCIFHEILWMYVGLTLCLDRVSKSLEAEDS